MGAGISSLSAGCRVAVCASACGVLTAAGCWALLPRPRRGNDRRNLVIVVTGCDSGLGFSMALRAHSRGATVVAACLDERGLGARRLQDECGADRMHVAALDVRDARSVQELVRRVGDILRNNPGMELRALVNNAGVMVFGEFEWQTEGLIQHQVDVNLLGTMRVTKAFCPLIRQHKGRILTITSHCASQSLPGLAVYGATKAALKGWCDGLRVEQSKYGVKVMTLVPGFFMMNSNLMARHSAHVQEMRQAMSPDDREFFGDYFESFHAALGTLAKEREPTRIDDERLHAMFDDAVLSPAPRAHYLNSPVRYSVYHWLFWVMPVSIRDLLMESFMCMPKWQGTAAETK